MLRLAVVCSLLLAVAAGTAASVSAQPTPADTTGLAADSTGPAPFEPTGPADLSDLAADTVTSPTPTALPGVTPAPPVEDGLESPVTYTARDSIRILLAGPDTTVGDRAWLYGDVTATYEDATLTAGAVEFDFRRQELRAIPAGTDSTGRPIPPRFAQGEESFTGQEFVYNLGSQRGRVVGARTAIEDGYLLGGVVKQAAPDIIYAENAAYTTCELDHPHYSLVAGKMKIVGSEYVYTGPVQLRLLGVPMPLWLPFGFFPAAEGRRSGPLPVTYGEDVSYGFYLDNVGWYWAVSDYFDALVRGRYGTQGSYQVGGRFNYVRRYAFDGSVDLSYGRIRSGERLDPTFSVRNDITVGWQHRQEFDPNTRLNANVNLRSSATRFTTERLDERIAQTSTSRVNFTKSWPRSGRSLGLDLSGTQRIAEGAADLTLPSLSFNQQRVFPFRRGARAGRDEAWFEKFSVDYRGTLTNTYAFTPLPDSTRAAAGFDDVTWVEGLFDYDAYRGATGEDVRYRPEAQHQSSLSAAYTFNRLPGGTPFFLTLSPALRYTENWFARSERRGLDETDALQITQEPGFTAVRRANLSLRAGTRLYGLFPFRVGPFEGLRHTLTPEASLSFEPDYTAAPFNYFRSYTDTTGTDVTYPIVSGLPSRQTSRLNFSLGNIVQSRRVRTDSTGEVSRETFQLFSLGLSSAYDFTAEERPFSDVSFNLTSQLRRVTARFSGALSPYALDSLGRPSPLAYITETGRLLRTTNLNLTLGASFGGGSRRAPSQGLGLPPGPSGALGPVGYNPADPDYGLVSSGYTDFTSPWSFSVDFTYGYTPVFGQEANQRAVLSISNFDFALTPRWKVAGSTSFDLIAQEITYTQLSVVRDLHCWEMRFNWIPLGSYRSFAFSIYVKSGYLRDLLRLDVPRSGVQTPVGSF